MSTDPTKTLVTTAEGELKAFGDWFQSSPFSHPKAVGAAVFVIGLVAAIRCGRGHRHPRGGRTGQP